MAQQDAMEQAKEVLRQIIKYRFWISVGVAALFGLIAYAVGSGPVKEQTKKEVAAIKSAESEVKQYSLPTIPTSAYQPIVEEKTAVLTKDVNAAWRTLYQRQAPLLTWPDTVQERFMKWGRKWPENVDVGRVTLAQVDYIVAYKDYVDMVYKTFKPFDYETGEGIVVAAPKEALLRPAVFSEEHVPGLSKIWSAQERLWIQRTMLEVVAQVNKNAKDWTTAVIRQIDELEVGSPVAQDQRSLAKNEELAEAPSILAPGETEETEQSAASGGGAGSSGIGASNSGMGGMGRMMTGGGATRQDSQSVYYVKSGNDQQYKVLPVLLTVLIDQDHVQDLLVELENSPMSIQVMEFELQRPHSRVTKPEKGAATAFAGGGEGMMMGGMGAMMGRGMTGFGGMMGQMQNQMNQMRNMMGRGDGMMGMGMGMAPGAGGGADARKGKDVRNKDRAKTREQQEKAVSKSQGPSLFDPYFDIVQVRVYGQARFFNPPPEEPAAEPSPGDTTAAASPSSAPAGAAADAKAATAQAPAAGADAKAAPAQAPAAGADAKGAPAQAPAAAGPEAKPAAQPESGAATKAAGSATEAGKAGAPPAAPKADASANTPKR